MATKKFKSAVDLQQSVKLSSLTANRALIVDGSNNLVVSTVTDTELGHLSGVTSAIQTQLGSKLDSSSSVTDLSDVSDAGSGIIISSAERSKLSGIEALADVTDATNVDAAGATMNTDSSLAGNSYFLDEDNMASDDATKVPSQQSVKKYVDDQFAAVGGGLSWKNSVKDVITDNTLTPPAEVEADRYLLSSAGGAPNANYDGASAGDIVTFTSGSWVAETPTIADAVIAEDETSVVYIYSGSAWVNKNFEATTGGTATSLVGNAINARNDGITIAVNGNNDLEVADGGIATLQLANSAVTEDKINGLAVTSTKIADNAVTENKLGADVDAESFAIATGYDSSTATGNVAVSDGLQAALEKIEKKADDAAGTGAVDSVNTQTGVVVLDADDISDAATTNKFVTAGDITKLGNLSGTNSGDEAAASQSVAGIAEVATVAEIDAGTDDTRMISPLGLAGSQIQTDVDANTAKVSADGLVTTHSDVSDAGSGIIISAAERTKLDGIEALADVTDATNVAAAGAVMESGSSMDSAANITFSGGGEILGLPATPSATGAASKEYVDNQISGSGSAGDISETSFAGAESASSASVTGLAFAAGTVRSFRAQVVVVIDATADLFEVFTLEGVNKGSSFDMSISGTGDDSLVSFTISTAGQVQYSSSTYAGFSSMDIRFRAETLSV